MVNETTESRKDKAIMRECVTALTDYAALIAANEISSGKTEKIRDLTENIILYWGLHDGSGAKPLDEFMGEFEKKVDSATRNRFADVDTYPACHDALTGLAQHGMDMINNHAGEAYSMNQALIIGRRMNEIAEYYGIVQEITYAEGCDRQFRNSVKGMLERMDLPGNAIEGVSNANYDVKQAITFENNVGFVFAHNPQAASPYVTWRTYENEGKPEYEWGNYFSKEEDALVDYLSRATNYAVQEDVKEKSLVTETQQDEEERKYKAEISVPDMEFPHFVIFHAGNDVDAIVEAHELCEDMESEGSYLLELHEVSEDYDIIREIDLRLHDPEARRFMDVDILDFLGQIADKTIIHCPDDFKIDVEVLWKAALSENPSEKRLMWHCCSYGTHILPEDEVFIKSTGSHGYWVDYRPKEPDMVGYAVEVTGYRDETVVGNVYDVGNYYSHTQHVRENSLVLDAVSLTYDDSWGINAGKTISVPRYEYDQDRHRLMSESGRVTAIKYHPSEASRTMAELLKSEKDKYMAMPVGDIKEHLEKLEGKLLELRGESKTKETLRIYHADFSDPEVHERMEIIVAKDDKDALRQADEICGESDSIFLLELSNVNDAGDVQGVEIAAKDIEIFTNLKLSKEYRERITAPTVEPPTTINTAADKRQTEKIGSKPQIQASQDATNKPKKPSLGDSR